MSSKYSICYSNKSADIPSYMTRPAEWVSLEVFLPLPPPPLPPAITSIVIAKFVITFGLVAEFWIRFLLNFV